MRERLYARLRQQAHPLFIFEDAVLPAAAIWTGTRAWVRDLREAGVAPGDRVLLALPPSPAFVQALLAGIWEGWTIALAPPGVSLEDTADALDARWVISETCGWRPDGVSGPASPAPAPRPTRFEPTPDLRFLLRTSGTCGDGTWIALTEAGVTSVIDNHLPELGYVEAETRVLSVLPWHHAFGLVLDLLPALLTGAEIVRDPCGGRDLGGLLDLADEHAPTHLNLVPLLARRLAADPRGAEFLRRLDGGIVGGAPVDAGLAEVLAGTRLRVGYGQTEASPGIALGAPGEWPGAGYLGRPLGCDTDRLPGGELRYRGVNVCAGVWRPESGLEPHAEPWRASGDLVAQEGDRLFFRGRIDDGFKLSNGRWVQAGPLEARLCAVHRLDVALLTPTDGDALELFATPRTGSVLPPLGDLRETLGDLGDRLRAVHRVAGRVWAWTPKGALDRAASHRAVAQSRGDLGPDRTLTCEQIEALSRSGVARPTLTDAARAGMERSLAAFESARERGEPIYGVTTGFGPFVAYASQTGGASHGAGLIAHLGAGWGEAAPEPVVRAAVVIRSQNLAQGWSGVAPALVDDYLALLDGDLPPVPAIGSVGASGDLIPLAHIASRLAERRPLSGREALSLTNGTSFLTAYAALAVSRADRLLARAETLSGWAYRLLGCRTPALDPRLHDARGHRGQRESARAIRREALAHGPYDETARPLQEVYSLRCAPQVLGACRENLDHARRLVEAEVNGVSDNPLFPDADSVLHGGNFHGQQVAFAADALNAALVQAAVLAERQLDAICTPGTTNAHAPLLLAWHPGAQSGLAGVQITATALVAEMRSNCQAHATFSIPTNGGNQDVVSMGTLAARKALEQTDRLAAVLAGLALALHQLDFLRREGRATGAPSPPPCGFPRFDGLRADRPLHDDLKRTAESLLAA